MNTRASLVVAPFWFGLFSSDLTGKTASGLVDGLGRVKSSAVATLGVLSFEALLLGVTMGPGSLCVPSGVSFGFSSSRTSGLSGVSGTS